MVFLAFAESVQIMPDFALVVHVLLILVMIWILNRTFFRPINRVIAARETGKGGEMSDTEKMLQSASDKQQKYKDDLLATRSKGYELIESKREAAIKERQEKVAAAKAEVESQKSANLKELSKLTEEAQNTISDEAARMADKISSNLINAA